MEVCERVLKKRKRGRKRRNDWWNDRLQRMKGEVRRMRRHVNETEGEERKSKREVHRTEE